MKDIAKKHGGKRPGAGRKPAGGTAGPSAVMRVPANAADTVRDFLAALKEKRTLEAQDNVAEVLELNPAQTVSLPLYTSKVAAGFPSPADDHMDARLNPSSYLVENEEATFCVRVKGDSMIDAGIFDNDVLIVDRSKVARVGDIVLAILDGEFTVKTLGRSKQAARLIPANKNYPIIEVKEGQSFEIWGVVTGSMRKFR